MKCVTFSKQFLLGSLSSAHQIEGHTHNNWTVKERSKRVAPCGVACDHFNRFIEDIDLIDSMHHQCFGLSIEWSRIEPQKGKIDVQAIEHYRQVLRYLKQKGIKRVVTLYHITHPVWFSWKTSTSVSEFLSYCALIAKELGTSMDYVIIMHEPHHVVSEHASTPQEYYTLLERIKQSLTQAYKKIKHYRPRSHVGIAHHIRHIKPASAQVQDEFAAHLFRFRTQEYFMQCPQDVMMLNYESTATVTYAEKKFWHASVTPSTSLDSQGLYQELMRYGKRHIPLFVSCGLADTRDTNRARFITQHLLRIAHASNQGVALIGFLYRSLFDGYEWKAGYTKPFGLVRVHPHTLKRELKSSATHYAHICNSRKILC